MSARKLFKKPLDKHITHSQQLHQAPQTYNLPQCTAQPTKNKSKTKPFPELSSKSKEWLTLSTFVPTKTKALNPD